MARTSNTMLNKSEESGYLCLVPDLREYFQIFAIEYDVSSGLSCEEKEKVAQLCLTLCDPRDCNPPGSSGPWNSSGKNTGVGCRPLLQGIFPTQGLNLGLLNCRMFFTT